MIDPVVREIMECGNCGTKWDDWTLPCPKCKK
jgi:hypothetical protein